jgi:flagellar export protein FliJ
MAGSGGKTFRLARLLSLREQQVATCQEKVASCRAELEAWEAHKREFQERRHQAGLTPGGGATSGALLRLGEAGRRWFAEEQARLDQEVERRRHSLEAARSELQEAERRRQRIDRLRERFEAESAREQKRLSRRRMNRWGQSPRSDSL